MPHAMAQVIPHQSVDSVFRYDVPGNGGSSPAFRGNDRHDDFLYLARLNQKLQNQFGDDYFLQCFSGESLLRLPESTLYSLARCYAEVFNESWGEEWTVESALLEIAECIRSNAEYLPIMTLLFREDRVIGFSWAFLMDISELTEGSGPFSSSNIKRHESVEVANYWMKSVGSKNQLLSIRELGVLKEYRQDKTPYLTLPIYEKANTMDCNVAFFRTKLTSTAFKWGLGIGYVPLQFFMVDDLLLMKGNITYAMSLLTSSLDKATRRKARVSIIENIKRYLCE